MGSLSTIGLCENWKKIDLKVEAEWDGRHSSVVLPVPTILWPKVRIPSTISTLFSIGIIEIVTRKGQKGTKKRPALIHILKVVSQPYERSEVRCVYKWILLKMGHYGLLYLSFCLFNTVDSRQTFNIKFAEGWI